MCEGEISGELCSNIFQKATVTKIAEIVDDVISRKFLNYLETVNIRAISLMKSVIRRLFRIVNWSLVSKYCDFCEISLTPLPQRPGRPAPLPASPGSTASRTCSAPPTARSASVTWWSGSASPPATDFRRICIWLIEINNRDKFYFPFTIVAFWHNLMTERDKYKTDFVFYFITNNHSSKNVLNITVRRTFTTFYNF